MHLEKIAHIIGFRLGLGSSDLDLTPIVIEFDLKKLNLSSN